MGGRGRGAPQGQQTHSTSQPKIAPRLHESSILTILGNPPNYAIPLLRHYAPWPNLWPLESILASSWDHVEASSGHLGPSRDHLGSSWAVLGPFSGPLGERTDDGRAHLAKFAPRLHESTILWSRRRHFLIISGSSWGHLVAILAISGSS